MQPLRHISLLGINTESRRLDISSDALGRTLLAATPSLISHLRGCPLSLSGLTCCHLPFSPVVSNPTFPACLYPHLALFLVSCVTRRWWVVRQSRRSTIGRRQNSYYLHLLVIYFSSVRLKMAARDGDRPVWPAKHRPPQILLFIHKLDPLGLSGRTVLPTRYLWFVLGGSGMSEWVGVSWCRFAVNLGLTHIVTHLTLSVLKSARSECVRVRVCAWAFQQTHTRAHKGAHTHTVSQWQTEATVLLSGNE